MDDSDSDDDFLLTQATFKPQRAAAVRQKKMEHMLDEALIDSERHHESLVRIQQIQRDTQHDDDDDDDERLYARVEQMSQSIHVRPKRPEEAFLEGDDAIPREKRIALQQAMDSDLICRLGARHGIVRFDTSRGGDVHSFFESENEAIEDLRRILNSDNKLPLYESFLKVADLGLVSDYLTSGRFVESIGGFDHRPICEWLLNVAYSAGLGDDMGLLADAATTTLLSLRAKSILTETISIQEFLGALLCWVDINRQVVMETNEEPMEANTTNIRGLLNFLTIHEMAISYTPDDEKCEAASQCIAILIRLGLDALLATRARDILQRLIATLIDLVAQNQSSDEELKVWCKATAKTALEGLTELGPGAEDTEDADDVGAWLCLSAAVRMVPSATTRESCSRAVLQFKAEIALQAVQALLVDEKDECNTIETYVEGYSTKTGQDTLMKLASVSVSWLALATSYAGLIEIEMQGGEIRNDPPKILAAVECLLTVCEAGMLLLSHDTTTAPLDESGAEYGSKANAKAFVSFVKVFDELLVRLSSRTLTNMATNPFFRRADMALMLFHTHNFVMKVRAEYLAGTMHGEVKQVKISSLFAPKPKPTSPIGGVELSRALATT